MSNDTIFDDLILRLRSGDPRAAEELVRKYEPVIRLEVRCRLRDRRLRRAFDSMDVCQSVLGSFFVRAAAGQYDLEQPDQLRKLLVGMARKKLLVQIRREQAQCRDIRRLEPIDQDECAAIAAHPSPSGQCEAKDLLHHVQQRLTTEERQLAEMRAQGQQWPDIAAQVGGTPRGRRMQLSRALDRVARELGLDEEKDSARTGHN
jgi:RNA polymerase sigma-70 factor (ECF subfamily)